MFLYYNDIYLMLITHILGLMSTDNQMYKRRILLL